VRDPVSTDVFAGKNVKREKKKRKNVKKKEERGKIKGKWKLNV
jgi:hypothetical protein